jgi:hypothetical protein
MAASFISTGCAEAKRTALIKKSMTNSCDLSEQGKNKFYYTKHYKRVKGRNIYRIERRD